MENNPKHTKPTSRKNLSSHKDSPKFRSFNFSRRQFLIGAGALGALACGGGGIIYFSSKGDNSGNARLNVPTSNVFGIDDCEKLEDSSSLIKLEREVNLPYDTLIFVSDDNVASLLLSTEDGSPINTASTINLQNANIQKVLTSPVTQAIGFDIWDFRTNENGCIWIEANILTKETIVYTSSSFAEASSNFKIAYQQKGEEFLLPSIAICKNYGWIQLEPASSNKSQKARLQRIELGKSQDSLTTIFETKAFATQISSCKDGVVASPRSTASSSCVELQLLDGVTAETLDICTLPQSMIPQDVSYSNGTFSFSFAGSYDYGAGISKSGTYTSIPTDSNTFSEILIIEVQSAKEKLRSQSLNDEEQKKATLTAKDKRNSFFSSQKWFNFGRTPVTSTAWIDSPFAVKSTRSIAIFDLENKKYCLIESPDGADDYGVFLCSCGQSEQLVTITNINYSDVKGAEVKKCLLQIWKKK